MVCEGGMQIYWLLWRQCPMSEPQKTIIEIVAEQEIRELKGVVEHK